MPELVGALMVHGQRVDMVRDAEDRLLIPVCPPGVYLAEVRAAGVCVLYGHVEVLPSPLYEQDGVVCYTIDVDAMTDVLAVSLSMVEGIPGPRGEQGIQGERGLQGASAYDLAVAAGYEGSEAEWVEELQGAQAAANAARASESAAAESARTAEADKTAAELARDDAQAAQEVAAAKAEKATEAAEAAQAPESLAVQAARPATMVLLRGELEALLGSSAAWRVDTDGQKIVVHTDRLADEQLAAVEDVLARFVPGFVEVVQYNHDISIPWQEIPEGFTVIEWLEATGTQKTTAPISATSEDTYEVKFSKADLNPSYSYLLWIGNEPGHPFCNESAPDKTEDGKSAISFLMRSSAGSWPSDAHTPAVLINADEPYILKIEKRGFYVDGKHYFTMDKNYVNPPFNCTSVQVPNGSINCKIFYAQVREKDTGKILLNLTPCLDDTGAP